MCLFVGFFFFFFGGGGGGILYCFRFCYCEVVVELDFFVHFQNMVSLIHDCKIVTH